MIFQCFYYPILNDSLEIMRSNNNLKEFNFGDSIPTKTLFYNYGSSFAIYEDSKFFIVEDGILTKCIKSDDLKFPLNLVFGEGTQLKIFSAKDLSSIRLLLKGEHEKEKELGELFYLSNMLNNRIKNVHYEILSELTNSSRDYNYINKEIESRTEILFSQLKVIEGKFYNMTIENKNLKDSYLNYMNFGNKEDLLQLSINKYFKEGTYEYNHYQLSSSIWKSKPIHPKFKLDNLIKSYNYRS